MGKRKEETNMNRKALTIFILIAALMICACAKGADSAPNDGVFDETAPGESYDLAGRMEKWYETVGVTGERMDSSEIENIFEGKSEDEQAYLEGFSLMRFSNGDILALTSAHDEHPENDEQLRNELAQALTQNAGGNYEIAGGDVYWAIIVSKDIPTAHKYYENSANGIAP